MPVRSIDKHYGKYKFFGPHLWKKYKAETGDNISYEDFRDITLGSIEEIKKWVLKEPIGFQLHPKMGNIAINKFMPGSDFKAYLNTPLGTIVNHNLHTGGYAFKVQWFHSHTSHACKQVYWYFKACRAFNRSLAAAIKGSQRPNYNSYMQSHFITNG